MNSGSFESVRWNVCVHRLDLDLYSHAKDFGWNVARTHVNSGGNVQNTSKQKTRQNVIIFPEKKYHRADEIGHNKAVGYIQCL